MAAANVPMKQVEADAADRYYRESAILLQKFSKKMKDQYLQEYETEMVVMTEESLEKIKELNLQDTSLDKLIKVQSEWLTLEAEQKLYLTCLRGIRRRAEGDVQLEQMEDFAAELETAFELVRVEKKDEINAEVLRQTRQMKRGVVGELSDDDDEDMLVVGGDGVPLTCPITGEELTDPYKIQGCGHILSLAGLQSLLKTKTAKCPQCKASFTRSDCGKDRIAKIKIDQRRQEKQAELDKHHASAVDFSQE